MRDAGHTHPVVLTDSHGVPTFPDGYLGSISHKYGRAVAVATRAQVVGVGIDLEFDESHDEECLRTEVITKAEQPMLNRIRAAEPYLLSPATLVLAAKEAVYKAVYPITQTAFAFDEVELGFVS